MTLENLRENIEREKEVIREIVLFNNQLINLERFYPYEKRGKEEEILKKTLNSLFRRLKIINNSIPNLIEHTSPYKKISKPAQKEPDKVKGLVKLTYQHPKKEEKEISVTLKKEEREKFLEELRLSRESIGRLKVKKEKVKKTKFMEFRKPSFYAKFSNKIFFNFSNSFVQKGRFKNVNKDLRKANMPYLLTTYLSMTFLSTLIAFIVGLIVFVILFLIYPSKVLISLLVIPLFPLITFFSLYLYPVAEGRSIGGKINQELPFVVLHMSAIARSGIEPSQIFKIIVESGEYKNTRKELRKIINQVNVYGYDLVTSLKNTARETPSGKLSELFNGLSTTITTGGSLTEFLDKRADTLLFDYKMEREKYTKIAETFMDIYISLIIAAPMIMMMMLILVSVSGIGIGLSLNALTAIIISVIALINIIFLVFLHLKQPSY